jgi:exosome complex exonuclease DIS3/RRP44
VAEEEEESEEKVSLAPETADDTSYEAIRQAKNASKAGLRPCGRVVGVIKRNWHS